MIAAPPPPFRKVGVVPSKPSKITNKNMIISFSKTNIRDQWSTNGAFCLVN